MIELESNKLRYVNEDGLLEKRLKHYVNKQKKGLLLCSDTVAIKVRVVFIDIRQTLRCLIYAVSVNIVCTKMWAQNRRTKLWAD